MNDIIWNVSNQLEKATLSLISIKLFDYSFLLENESQFKYIGKYILKSIVHWPKLLHA